jgi:hypothetical protein
MVIFVVLFGHFYDGIIHGHFPALNRAECTTAAAVGSTHDALIWRLSPHVSFVTRHGVDILASMHSGHG